MNPFGDGSDGALNVASGTTNLALNVKHQFTTVNIASGATLSTASTTGAVLYICANTSFTLDGAIDVSNKVDYGNNTWGVTIDGNAYNSPGVGAGVRYSGQPSNSTGFGSGGSGGGFTSANGGSSSTPGSSIIGGNSVSASRNIDGATNTAGTPGSNSGGGSGGARSAISTGGAPAGSAFSTATSGQGATTHGGNGADGSGSGGNSPGNSGGWTWQAGGGGGGGGRAGRAGVHVVIKSPVITINGTIITSGTGGGTGGNGGRNFTNSVGSNVWGGAGLGAGGGSAGNITVYYAQSLTDGATKTMAGGSGSIGGYGGTGFNQSIIQGVSGSNGSFSSIPVLPIADFSGTPTSGNRPLNVSFTNLSLASSTYLWDFGDGTTSTFTNPSKTYSSTGTYTVSLTATAGANSDIEVKTNYITTTIETFTRSATGTLTFSGGADRVLSAYRSATGTLTFSGSAFAIRKSDSSAIEKKTFMAKVYDEDGNFVGVYPDIHTDFNWSEEINSAGSAINITLARNSDSLSTSTSTLLDSAGLTIKDSDDVDILTTTDSRYKVGAGSNVAHNYRVDLYVFYGEVSAIQDNVGLDIEDSDGAAIMGTIGAPNGIRRVSGFISEINSQYGDDETTQIQIMTYGYDLDQYIVRTSGGDTTVPFNSTDPGQMIRTALPRFTADGSGDTFTTFDNSTVQLTGIPTSYTFRANTYLELLQKAVQLAPSDWYFYVDLGSNLIYFKAKDAQPTHTFYLGKHIKDLNMRSYIGDVVNDVLFTGGGDPALFKRYTVAPLAGTRRGLSRLSDNRVELEASADILSNGEIDEKKAMQYRSTIAILDKTYDIESINVGDTVNFRNFDNYIDTPIMQIVALNYTPDVVTLQLDTLPQSTNKRLEELRRNLNVQENQNVPNVPDV